MTTSTQELAATMRQFHAHAAGVQALTDALQRQAQPLVTAIQEAAAPLAGLSRELDRTQGLLAAWKAQAAKLSQENRERVARLEAKNLELATKNRRLARRVTALLHTASDKGEAHLGLVSAALEGDAQALANLHELAATGYEVAAVALRLCAELAALRKEVSAHRREVHRLQTGEVAPPRGITHHLAPPRYLLASTISPNAPNAATACASEAVRLGHSPHFPARKEPAPT